MADENEVEVENPGKKKKLIIIIVAVVVLLGGGGAAAFFMMGGEEAPTEMSEDMAMAEDADGEAAAETEGSEESAEDATMGTAIYVPMPRPFRFNVKGESRDRFAEIRVQLLVRGSENEELVKKHIPLIESTLTGVFARSSVAQLATSEGKTELKQKALIEVQNILKEIEDKEIVDKVLFTGFVMQ